MLVLAVATLVLLNLCWKILQPFLSPLAWAVALAIVARPLQRWISTHVHKCGLSAGIAVLVVALFIIGPALFVGHQLVKQATAMGQVVQEKLADGKWKEELGQKNPKLAGVVQFVEQSGVAQGQGGMSGDVAKKATGFLTGSVKAVIELLLTLFFLFFLFRDRAESERGLRSMVPLSDKEATEVMKRVGDTVHATIYGTLVVAAVQGTLGGLMFWWLGLPAPILWGAVMALLAIIPILGAFVIWLPAAIYLAMSGQMGKALILTAWGTVVIGLIDNLLYPMLVGNRMRMHTVPVFIAIVGGLAVFGASGLVLGPVILALTFAALEIWKRRTSYGKAAESAVTPREAVQT